MRSTGAPAPRTDPVSGKQFHLGTDPADLPLETVVCADCRYELRTEAERVLCDVGSDAPVTLCYGCAMRRARPDRSASV